MPTQNEMILYHFKKYGSITQREALNHYGCMRLPARIKELRNSGYPIETEMQQEKNRFGKLVSFGKYTMPKEYRGRIKVKLNK